MKTKAQPLQGTGIKRTAFSIRILIQIVLIVLVCMVLYSPASEGVFLMDDYAALKNNPYLAKPARMEWLTQIPPESNLPGRPFAQWSFAINALWPGDPLRLWHIGNLLIHVFNAVLLFLLTRFLMIDVLKWTSPFSPWLPFSIALLWSVHPLHTHAVTYLSQRAEIQMSLGVLGALYFGRTGGTHALTARQTLLCLLFILLAVGTKEHGILIPFLLFSFYYVTGSKSVSALLRDNKWLWTGCGLSFFFFYFLLRSSRPAEFLEVVAYSPLEYLKIESLVFFKYAAVFLYPFQYPFDYYWSYIPSLPLSLLVLSLQAALFLTACYLVYKRSWYGWALLSIYIILAPTSSVIPMLDPMVAYRYYLPGAFLLLLLLTGIGKGAEILVSRKFIEGSRINYLAAAMGLLVCGAFGQSTYQRNQLHQSAIALWSDSVEKNPESPRAHLNLGIALLKNKEFREALASFERASGLSKRSDQSALISYHTGIAHFALADYQRAIPFFSKAIEFSPGYWDAYIKRAHTNMYLRNYEAAAADQLAALQQVKNNPDLVMQYVYSLVKTGKEVQAQQVIDSSRNQGMEIPPDLIRMIRSETP